MAAEYSKSRFISAQKSAATQIIPGPAASASPAAPGVAGTPRRAEQPGFRGRWNRARIMKWTRDRMWRVVSTSRGGVFAEARRKTSFATASGPGPGKLRPLSRPQLGARRLYPQTINTLDRAAFRPSDIPRRRKCETDFALRFETIGASGPRLPGQSVRSLCKDSRLDAPFRL